MYLAYFLNHPLTKRQIYSRVFIETTLPNIGDQWSDLELPVHNDQTVVSTIKTEMKMFFEKCHEIEELFTSLLDKSTRGIRQTTPTK